jgi:hypothetical protein
MQLACKTCGKPIPAEDVNIKLAIAKCHACHAVFAFADDLGTPTQPRPEVLLPPRFKLDAWGPEMTITRSWFSHSVWFLIPFAIFWNGFLVVWYSIGIRAVMSGEKVAWIMLAFPVLHVAVGIGLVYAVLCMLLNKTVIRISSGELSVWNGPLPCGGNRRLFTSDVKQLFCSEKSHKGKHGMRHTYKVEVLKRDDSKVELVTGLEELDQALFIEQHLRIVDERVPGEVRV